MAIAGVLDDFLGSPVSRQNSSLADAHRRHLEGKQIDIGLHSRLSHLRGIDIEDAAIPQETSREAAKHDDLVRADLDNAGALPLGKMRSWHVDNNPAVGPVLRVVPLDRVAILLAGLGDAAEDEDEALVKGAARVVVPAYVQVRNFEPKVKVDVVLLASFEGIVLFTPRARHDEELVIQTGHCVAMPLILHVVHGEAVENARSIVHDLEALLERGRLPLDVTATNQEQFVTWCLDVGEIVLETCLHVDLTSENDFLDNVILVDELTVSLKHID